MTPYWAGLGYSLHSRDKGPSSAYGFLHRIERERSGVSFCISPNFRYPKSVRIVGRRRHDVGQVAWHIAQTLKQNLSQRIALSINCDYFADQSVHRLTFSCAAKHKRHAGGHRPAQNCRDKAALRKFHADFITITAAHC